MLSYAAQGIGRFSARSLSDKACDESDEISPVVQSLVVDWTATRRVGGSFDTKDWAPLFNLQCRGDLGLSCHCVQLVLGFSQRNIVFAFQERRDRLDLRLLVMIFLPISQGR